MPANKTTGKNPARDIPKRGMSANLKATSGVVALALLIIVGAIVASQEKEVTPAAAAQSLVRENSHRLSTAADGKTTVVEFLDFECEACGAAYPDVEKLRAEYGDRITYVVRYFPIASHPNAFNAAHAAEAAARQGKFEEMYKKLFDNQGAWGHKEESQAAVFEQYATELGLDLAKFKADVLGPEVAARVEADFNDGKELGVQGTPTFFIDGAKHNADPSYDLLKAAVDRSLTR